MKGKDCTSNNNEWFFFGSRSFLKVTNDGDSTDIDDMVKEKKTQPQVNWYCQRHCYQQQEMLNQQ